MTQDKRNRDAQGEARDEAATDDETGAETDPPLLDGPEDESEQVTAQPESAEQADMPDTTDAAPGEPEVEPSVTPEPDTTARAHSAPTRAEQGGGAGSMIIGGVLAAAIGAVAALVFLPEGWRRGDTTILQERIEALETRPAGLQASDMNAALVPIAARIEALETRAQGLETRVQDIEGQTGPDLAPLRDRIAALEAAPDGVPESQLDGAIGALAQRLDRIEAGLDARTRGAVEAALADARAQIEAQARQLEDREETVAEAQARIAARAALADLIAAAESGEAAPGALATLTDQAGNVAALAPLADGLPTLAALQERFAIDARAALAADTPAEDAPLSDRLVTFLRSQTGARSLAPREGDGTDAVLSRAEAALRAGDLPGTLTELDALQDAPSQTMADWRAAAETRLAALTALDDMQARLTGNED